MDRNLPRYMGGLVTSVKVIEENPLSLEITYHPCTGVDDNHQDTFAAYQWTTTVHRQPAIKVREQMDNYIRTGNRHG